MLALALFTGGFSSAEIPDFLHPFVNDEDEIANCLQVSTRFLAPPKKIQCDQQIGGDPRCFRPHRGIKISTKEARKSKRGKSVGDPVKCPLCAKHVSTPILFGVGRADGLGQTLGNIIVNLAIAWNNSFAFGGFLLHSKDRDTEPDFYKTLSSVLGFNYELLHPRVEPQQFGTCVRACRSLKALKNWQGLSQAKTQQVLLDATQLRIWNVVTPSFLVKWRAVSGALKRSARFFSEPGFHIAVHVRRGDIQEGSLWDYKLLSDAVYINASLAVQAMLPKAHVHMFSTTFDHISRQGTYDASQFNVYKKHGFQVHLDNAEIDDMIHFAQADVLICSRSAFSNIVSVLNAKCVLHPNGRADPASSLPNAPYHYQYNAEDGTLVDSQLDEFRHCLDTKVLKTRPLA